MTQYFIKRSDKVNGPFTPGQIKSGFKSQKLKPTDLVATSEAGPWKPLSDFYQKNEAVQTRSTVTPRETIDIEPAVQPKNVDGFWDDFPAAESGGSMHGPSWSADKILEQIERKQVEREDKEVQNKRGEYKSRLYIGISVLVVGVVVSIAMYTLDPLSPMLRRFQANSAINRMKLLNVRIDDLIDQMNGATSEELPRLSAEEDALFAKMKDALNYLEMIKNQMTPEEKERWESESFVLYD